MKTKNLLFGLLAALAVVGCSSEDAVTVDGGNANISDGTPRYLTVNIMQTAAAPAGRAAVGTYVDGSSTENKVSKVRFYFFTDDGNAANVKKQGTGYTNWYDWTPSSSDTNLSGDKAMTVEEKLNATIVISTPGGDRVPSKLIAVLNPDKINGLGNNSRDLYSLRSIQQDWAALANSADSDFVMCNSVWASVDDERVSTSTITADNLKTDATEALANPVKVYVEREVAKVSLSLDASIKLTDNSVFEVKDNEGNVITATKTADDNTNAMAQEVPIYVKPLYWTLTATTEKANLSKHINPEWKNGLLDENQPWTTPDYHRSFWAVNCLADAMGTAGADVAGYKYYSYDDIKEQNHKIGGEDVIYTNENAGANYTSGLQREYPTQVIGAMQLVDKDGNPLTVAEYAGNKMVGETSLKNAMINMLGEDVLYYKDETITDKDKSQYVKITPDDITFKTESKYNTQIAGGQDNEGGRYYVRATLSTQGQGKTWYKYKDGNFTNDGVTTATVNTELESLGQAKLWKDGMTYYFFKVKHLAAKDVGMYGVVRNHFYQCNITDIIGLGTPVYDPKEVIYPETPVDQNTSIAAEINILQWRVVKSDVTFGQKEATTASEQ